MSVAEDAHQTFIKSLELKISGAVDPNEAWKEEKKEHNTTKNCGWEDENAQEQVQQQQQRRRRQRQPQRQQEVEQGGDEDEAGPSLEDVKRALRQKFRDTGVVDDVTVRGQSFRFVFCTAVSSVSLIFDQRQVLYDALPCRARLRTTAVVALHQDMHATRYTST